MGGGAKDAGRRRSEKPALGAAQGLCRKSKTRENDAPKSADQSAAYAGRVKNERCEHPFRKGALAPDDVGPTYFNAAKAAS